MPAGNAYRLLEATGEDPGTIHPCNLVGGSDAGDMRPE